MNDERDAMGKDAAPEERSTERPRRRDPGRPRWLRIIDRGPDRQYTHQYEDPSLHLGRSLESANRVGSGGGGTGARYGGGLAAESLLEDGAIPEFDAALWESGAAGHDNIGRHEHLVFHPDGAARAYKVTKPGHYGAGGDLARYLARIEEVNRLFDDDVWVEGAVRDSATGQYRLVTSQPWIADARAATSAEIDFYFELKGYHRFSDRSFFHPTRETLINDAEATNVIVGPPGIVYPIDVIPSHPTGGRLELIERVVEERRKERKASEAPPI